MKTIPQICETFDVHPMTVHRWIKAGKLNAFKAHIQTKRKHKKVWCVAQKDFDQIAVLMERNALAKYNAMVEGRKRLNAQQKAQKKERSNE